MQRFIVSIAMVLIIAACARIPAFAQEKHERSHKQDTGSVTLSFDGKEHTATAVAYVIDGRLFISGIWVRDSSAHYGTDAIASAYTLRVENTVGEHPIDAGSSSETLFSTVYSGAFADKAYSIFRTDERGGNGSVTILSITDVSVRGAFSFTAYNKDKPTEYRTITGRFDIPYRVIVQ